MWIADLSPWPLFDAGTPVVAVGWLERGKAFRVGDVDHTVYDALASMRLDPWQPFVAAGPHACDLCRFDGPSGTANLFVPSGRCIYVCPELIVHYINAHGYAPPEEFCAAVLECPPMRSMQYLKALIASGGKGLVESSRGRS